MEIIKARVEVDKGTHPQLKITLEGHRDLEKGVKSKIINLLEKEGFDII